MGLIYHNLAQGQGAARAAGFEKRLQGDLPRRCVYNRSNAGVSRSLGLRWSVSRANSFSLRSSLAGPARYRTAVTLVLALVALVGYGLYTVQSIRARGLFDYVGVDFRTYYASGLILREHGAGAVYDLSLQTAYQKALYDQFAIYVKDNSLPYYVIPTPYPPIYVLLFSLLSVFPPLFAFLVWEGLNIILFLVYSITWVKRLNLKWLEGLGLVAMLFLSVQNFHNLFSAQVNLFLMISIGETLFNVIQKRNMAAGICLSLGLLKPHAILLMVLLFLVLRKWRLIFGFLISATAMILASLAMLGYQGTLNYIEMLSSYDPLLRLGGMTWMSLVDNLTLLGLQRPTAFVIGGGMALVVLMAWAYILWQMRRYPSDEAAWDEVFLLTSATQAIVAPHGYVYMALMLGVPWLVYVNRHNDTITWLAFLTWGIGLGLIFIAIAQKSLGNAVFILGMFTLMMHVFIMLLVYENWKAKTQH